MKRKILQEAKRMARTAGFHDVRIIGKWEDYEVAEPIFTDGKMHCIGFPQYILCKDGVLRWSKDNEEGLRIMDTL